jgi:hypothetical protein
MNRARPPLIPRSAARPNAVVARTRDQTPSMETPRVWTTLR